MRLRKLEIKDAPLMLEWMHDDKVVHDLNTNFAIFTLEDCERFILKSYNDIKNIHMAIIDENDEYMGTVSLKNIDSVVASSEFAITIRKVAMGNGYSQYGMSEVINYGFSELGLKTIYWCVSPENRRAIRFYDKNGYQRIEVENLNLEVLHRFYNDTQIYSFIWYQERCKEV